MNPALFESWLMTKNQIQFITAPFHECRIELKLSKGTIVNGALEVLEKEDSIPSRVIGYRRKWRAVESIGYRRKWRAKGDKRFTR